MSEAWLRKTGSCSTDPSSSACCAPVILTQAVDALFQAAAVLEASSSAADTQQKVHESKTIIEQCVRGSPASPMIAPD